MTKVEETIIVKGLIDKYQELKPFASVKSDRLRINSDTKILKIIKKDEDKVLFHKWKELRSNRVNKKNKTPKNNIKKKSVENVQENIQENIQENVQENIQENIQENVQENVQELLNQIKRLKKERNNLNNKLIDSEKIIDDQKELYENIKSKYDNLKKEYHEICIERNKLELTCEGHGWSRDKLKELERYKNHYKKCHCGYQDLLK